MRRHLERVQDMESILHSQSSRSSHCVALVGCDNFLVRFNTAVYGVRSKQRVKERCNTDAPPEQSEPAITRMRGGAIAAAETK